MAEGREDWIIQAGDWPPSARPRPPFGPTELEIIKSCPLRVCFGDSKKYPRRVTYPGKVGTAFHRALQALMESEEAVDSAEHAIEIASAEYGHILRGLEADMDKNPRESMLRRDPVRARAGLQALVLEARAMFTAGLVGTRPPRSRAESPGPGKRPVREIVIPDQEQPVEVEVEVASKDGLFRGFIDRVEHRGTGAHLIDYKTSKRDDLPERYERQLQLYAFLWEQTRGYWPTSGEVFYPLTGRRFAVDLSHDICVAVAHDFEELVNSVMATRDPSDLGTPGEVCQVCEYRPWCRPFGAFQAGEVNDALALQGAGVGFDGDVEDCVDIGGFVKLQVRWRSRTITMKYQPNRLPHLRQARRGTRLRVLDSVISGLRHAPTATVTESTEVFVVGV